MLMSFDSISGQIQAGLNYGLEILTEKGKALGQADLLTLAVVAVIGALFCFFGLKMVRVWAAVLGLAVGFSGGACLAAYFGLEGYIPLIIGAAAGIILAVLGAGFYLAGVFLVCWILGISGSAYVMQPRDWRSALFCVGIGLVIGLITLKFAEPVTMLVTALFGGCTAGQAAYIMLPVKNEIVHIAVVAVLVILGILVQFLLESKKRKHQHLKKAEEIRNKHSVANEVDKARAMMENLDSAQAGKKAEEEDKAVDTRADILDLDGIADYDDELDEDEFSDKGDEL